MGGAASHVDWDADATYTTISAYADVTSSVAAADINYDIDAANMGRRVTTKMYSEASETITIVTTHSSSSKDWTTLDTTDYVCSQATAGTCDWGLYLDLTCEGLGISDGASGYVDIQCYDTMSTVTSGDKAIAEVTVYEDLIIEHTFEFEWKEGEPPGFLAALVNMLFWIAILGGIGYYFFVM